MINPGIGNQLYTQNQGYPAAGIQAQAAPMAQPNEGPVVSDKVDFSDGVNNPIELALLPSVDQVLNLALSDQMEAGKQFQVAGYITKGEGENTKPISTMEYRIDAKSSTHIEQKGVMLNYTDNPQDELKGTYFKDTIQTDPYYPNMMYINGTVSTDPNNTQQNETLTMQAGMGNIAQMGQVNGFEVQQQQQMDYYGNVNSWGSLAGTQFQRQMIPDFPSKTFKIQGQFGNMIETGEGKPLEGGGVLINRKIGDYNIVQRITPYTPPPPQNNGPEVMMA